MDWTSRPEAPPPEEHPGRWKRFQQHPVLAAFTPLGWLLLAIAVFAVIPAWLFGWLELRALWVVAVVVLGFAAISVLGRREHEVSFDLERPRVQAGDTVAGRVLVRPRGAKRSAPATLEFLVDREVASFRVPELRSPRVHEEVFAIPTTRRGVIELGPVRSVQADPLYALSREKILSDVTQLYVHPRVISVGVGAIGFLRDVEGIATSNLSSSDVSFHALREYIPGDDRRSVHWRTTARVGKLMVRQFEETLRAHLLIMMSTRAGDYETEEDFELAVSVAGSLGASALREERQVTFHTSTEALRFPDAIGLLDRLAGVELVEDALTLRQVAARHAGIPGLSVAAVISGTPSVGELRGIQRTIPAGVFSFALRCRSGLKLARTRVGAMSVTDLSQLDHLRPALRSLR